MRAMDLYAEARGEADPARQVELFKRMWSIAADEVWDDQSIDRARRCRWWSTPT